MSRPAYLATALDPNTNTHITRISDQTAFGSSAQYLRHNYAKMQPWNFDHSKIVLAFNSPHTVLHGTTYALLGMVSLPGNPMWSNTNPQYLYGVLNGPCRLVRADMNNSAARTTVKDFTSALASMDAALNWITLGDGEGNQSNDDRYFAFFASNDPTYNKIWLFVYDAVANSIVGSFNAGTTYPDWIAMSQSGTYVVVNWGTEGSGTKQGTKCYTRSFTLVQHLTNGIEHSDLGINTAGQEVLVTINYLDPGAQVESIRLDTAAKAVVLPNPPNYFYNGHVSCRNLTRPGWTYLSYYGSQTAQPGYDEVIAVKLDGSATVERFGHEHHTAGMAYGFEATAVPSRDGKRVMFASDWLLGASAPVYSYVANWP